MFFNAGTITKFKGDIMKLNSMIEKEEMLVEERIRFFRMVNGLLAGGFFVGCAIAIYKIVGLFF